MRPRRALVLSGSIGQGHDSAATACASALCAAGLEAGVVDCMKLLGGAGAAFGEAVFRRLLSVPPLYDAFHFSLLRGDGWPARSLERAAAVRLLPRLRTLVDESGIDLLVAVFATGSGAAGRLRLERPVLRAATLCTDSTAHRLWVHRGIDRYLVGSEMAAGTLRGYLPAAEISLLAPPVRPELFAAPSRADARAGLGLSPGEPTALVMGGGWGLGPIDEIASRLATSGVSVLALAGRNAPLLRRLEQRARQEPRLRPLAYSEQMASLYSAVDVVVTTAGQACHEARVIGRPLVLLDAVPGHGRENVLAELAKGGAVACPPRGGAVVDAVRAALDGRFSPAAPWPVESAEQWAEQLRMAVLGKPD